ncbi:MAG: polyribonucleotide nucleotidyltransferase [Crocinitomicaceae bacterium]|nr:polyribonucleotide nucleotidyltransferase [Crocinitomicaceae bacterium]|tara:strand:+ start:7727 stop:9832 length:2106 start_codon:yes stop_codon:yes gene_type:complete
MKIGIEHTFNTGGVETTLETGKLAKQADGSVVLKQGNTMLLATVVSATEAKEGVDFLPLTVEYREKFASTGKFPGGFIKREARPSEDEILTARLIDRALRPLFPSDYHAETQVVVNLISSDKETMPDALACFAASAALAVSDIPFNGPVSEVRVSRINGEFVINPKLSQLEESDIDMIIAGSQESIVMVEGEMSEISEEEMLEAILFAHEAIKGQCQAQADLAAQVEKAAVKREYSHEVHDEELEKQVFEALYKKLYDIAAEPSSKQERSDKFKEAFEEYSTQFSEEELEEKAGLIGVYFNKTKKEAVRNLILEKGVRLDGRTTTDIRDIWTEVGYLPGTHGSAIFTRGETQSLTSITLGTKLDQQNIDGAFIQGSQKFLLHYNFPPFSTGEARPIRSTSRREIGHGNLAMRALKPMVPADFPYTVRVVSDILESNGSSSMATVCAGSLALMDAGVTMKKPVSGIAMGLITGKDNFAVLSDILGDEDALGDMDFKVAGTRDGITACQMDIKVDGITREVLQQALEQAKAGRMHILDKMSETISEPNTDLKPNAPRLVQIKIPKELIGAVIGPGGKIIQEIQNTTGATVMIEEEGNFGIVDIAADNKESLDGALQRIKAITAQPEVGEIYMGKVKAIAPYGAFVEIIPGKDGLLHISEIDHSRVEKVEDVLKEGDQVKVKLIAIDDRTGKMKLSRKVLIEKE